MSIITLAVRIYARIVHVCARHVSPARRRDMAQALADRLQASGRGTFTAIGITAAEIADVVFVSMRARVAPARITSSPRDAVARAPRRVSTIGVDVRHALRRLAARRADAALVISLLALGVATSAVVFGVADALLVRPAPFPDASRLVQVWNSQSDTRILTPSMPIDLASRWAERRDLFASAGAYTSASALVSDHGDPEIIPAALLSPGLLETLGVPPLLGRTFAPDEGRAGTDRVVMLSEQVWTSRFGRSREAVGQSMRINGNDYRVIGVMPASFQFPFSAQRLWMPISLTAPAPADRARFLTVTARMRPGISRDALRANVVATGAGMAAQASRPWPYGAVAQFLDTPHSSDAVQRSIELLAAATLLLVLMVGLTVANLGLARVLARSRDMALRSALGASRARLVRQAVVEDLIVGLIALGVAWPLTVAGLQAARAWLPAQFTRMTLHVIDLDWRIAAVAIALALATPVLSGLIPAFIGSRVSVTDVLRLDHRTTAGGRASRWLRHGLVVLEVACAVVLIASAALLGRSFLRLQTADLGFDSRNLISANVGFPRSAFPTASARDAYIESVVSQIARVPGVRAVAPATGVPPINGLISFGGIRIEGQPTTLNDVFISGYDVTPAFFSTVGIRVTAGRPLIASDDRTHVVISESLAATLWPGGTAVGHRFQWDDDARSWLEVVGVAATIRETSDAPAKPLQLYLPLAPSAAETRAPAWQTTGPIGGYLRIAVRADQPVLAIPAVRQILRAAEPAILITAVERVDDELAQDLDRPRFLLALMTVFAIAGLTLAAAGVYGVLAYLVSQRLRELGVRLMLGAEPRRLGRGVLLSGLTTVAAGLAMGLAGAFAVSRLVGSLLFEVNARDPLSYLVVMAVILTAGGVAAWWPARRAMRVDPLALLRSE